MLVCGVSMYMFILVYKRAFCLGEGSGEYVSIRPSVTDIISLSVEN